MGEMQERRTGMRLTNKARRLLMAVEFIAAVAMMTTLNILMFMILFGLI